jgi:hypothetical protein
MEAYRKAEWNAMLHVVEEIFEKLTLMSESGNSLLKPHFERLLAGSPRAARIDQLRRRHGESSLEPELAEVVAGELRAFRDDRRVVFVHD